MQRTSTAQTRQYKPNRTKKDNEFDFITNVVSVDYLNKPKEIFQEMRRTLLIVVLFAMKVVISSMCSIHIISSINTTISSIIDITSIVSCICFMCMITIIASICIIHGSIVTVSSMISIICLSVAGISILRISSLSLFVLVLLLLVVVVVLFQEMHRVMKPGGVAIMSFSNRCFGTKALVGKRHFPSDHASTQSRRTRIHTCIDIWLSLSLSLSLYIYIYMHVWVISTAPREQAKIRPNRICLSDCRLSLLLYVWVRPRIRRKLALRSEPACRDWELIVERCQMHGLLTWCGDQPILLFFTEWYLQNLSGLGVRENYDHLVCYCSYVHLL